MRGGIGGNKEDKHDSRNQVVDLLTKGMSIGRGR